MLNTGHISRDSLTTLLTELKDIGSWESLCTFLKVETAVMEELQHNPSHNSRQNCLSSYLDSGKGNWKEIVRVICRYPFYKVAIGKKIARKYNVPIEECKDNNT